MLIGLTDLKQSLAKRCCCSESNTHNHYLFLKLASTTYKGEHMVFVFLCLTYSSPRDFFPFPTIFMEMIGFRPFFYSWIVFHSVCVCVCYTFSLFMNALSDFYLLWMVWFWLFPLYLLDMLCSCLFAIVGLLHHRASLFLAWKEISILFSSVAAVMYSH